MSSRPPASTQRRPPPHARARPPCRRHALLHPHQPFLQHPPSSPELFSSNNVPDTIEKIPKQIANKFLASPPPNRYTPFRKLPQTGATSGKGNSMKIRASTLLQIPATACATPRCGAGFQACTQSLSHSHSTTSQAHREASRPHCAAYHGRDKVGKNHQNLPADTRVSHPIPIHNLFHHSNFHHTPHKPTTLCVFPKTHPHFIFRAKNNKNRQTHRHPLPPFQLPTSFVQLQTPPPPRSLPPLLPVSSPP